MCVSRGRIRIPKVNVAKDGTKMKENKVNNFLGKEQKGIKL